MAEDFIPSVQDLPSPEARPVEPFIPRAEDTPVQPQTTATYFSPDEARSRFAQYLPIQSTPNDVLLPSDDPRVYTYQMPSGDIYYVPAMQEQLQERRSVGEAFNHLVDSFPSRTEVEQSLLNLPQATYNTMSDLVGGQGSYEDMLNVAGGLAGVNLGRTIPEDSLGMFTGRQGNYPTFHNTAREDALYSANSPEEVWRDTKWRLREQGSPFDYTEISDQYSDLNHSVFNQVVNRFWDPSVSQISVKLSDIFNPGYDNTINTELFSVYPALQNIRVSFIRPQGGTKGSFNPTTGNISIAIDAADRAKLSENVRSTLLHEIQHWVQNYEDWPAQGSNPDFLDNMPRDTLWQGIQPDTYNNLTPEASYLSNLIDGARSYGTVFWQREFLREYELEPDRVYNSIVQNIKPENRNAIEQLVVSDYEYWKNGGAAQPVSQDTWTVYDSSTYLPGQLEATAERLDMEKTSFMEDVLYEANRLGMLPEELEVFKELGLVSSSDNFASYMSEQGEIQARNTQYRADMPATVRYQQFPENTEYSRQVPWNMFQINPLRVEAKDIAERLLGGTP